MPISPDGQVVPMMPHQINVPVPDGSGFSVTVMVQSDGSVSDNGPAMDAALVDLIDYLQEWPGRHPSANVTGQKSEYRVWSATPTNPVVVDPPEEEPEDPGDGPGEDPAAEPEPVTPE